MSSPIADYGLVGDGQTAALVGRDGSIDWLCWPRFDSDACLAALLGDERHGCWSMVPTTRVTDQFRRYEKDTLILQAVFRTRSWPFKDAERLKGVGISATTEEVGVLPSSGPRSEDIRSGRKNDGHQKV